MTSTRPYRITISDVARRAGVSPTTVSHALNGRGQVDPQTRQRVIEAAQELDYRPNRHAQRLRTGGASMIALMSSMPYAVAGGASRLGFLMEVASVAATSALERGLAMVLVPPLASGASPLDMLDIDGALLVEPSADDPQLASMIAKGLPVVSIGRPGNSDLGDVPCVDLRSAETVELLLGHMLEQDAQKIALVLGTAQRNSYMEAEDAYLRMISRTGRPDIRLRVDEACGEHGGREAAEQLLSTHPDIDAMLILVDAFAVGAVQYVQETGRKIPEDMLIATRYDGIRARTCEPALTAVNMHLDEVARQATSLLFERLSGPVTNTRLLSPMPELVIRASTLRKAA